MTRASRKHRERFLLLQFLQKGSMLGDVRDGESPDFLTIIDGREVGIEVTELHHTSNHPSSSLQAREAVASRVVTEARRMFEEAGGPSLRVSLLFSPAFDPTTVKRQSLAKYVCDLVQRILPAASEVKNWRPERSDYRQGTPLVSFLHVLHQPQHIRAHWHHAEAGWVAPITFEIVQAVIDKKSPRLPEYRLNTPEVWLLIGIYGRTPSQFFDSELHFSPSHIRSPFDRTYLFDAFQSQAIPLGEANGA